MKRFLPTSTFYNSVAFCFLAFFACGLTSVTAKQLTVLLQGKLLDEKTGQPVEAKYVIATPSGKNLKGKSTADGSFKQVLNAGESYTITFNDYNIVKMVSEFSMPASEKYYEEKKEFRVRVLRSGDQLLSMAGFDKSKPSLTQGAVSELTKIAELLKENRSLEINMTVAADEVPKKEATKSKSKKQKKGKKTETVVDQAPAADAAASLAQARVDALRKQMEQIDAAVVKRITFINSPSPSASATLVVDIGQVKNRFE